MALASPVALPLMGGLAESDAESFVADLRARIIEMQADWPSRLLVLTAVWFWEKAQLPVDQLEPLLAELERDDEPTPDVTAGAAAEEGAASEAADAGHVPEDGDVAGGTSAATLADHAPVATSAGVLLEQAGRGRFGLRDIDAPAMRAVPELFTVEPVRPAEWLARGYLGARTPRLGLGLHPPSPEAGFAFEVGRLIFLVEQEDDRAIAAAGPGLLTRVVTTAGLECLTAPLLRALVGAAPDTAVDVLRAEPRPFPGWASVVRPVLDAARARIDDGDPISAERLLAALDDHLTLASVDPTAPGPAAASSTGGAADELAVVRARCRRVRNDFTGALALLDRVAVHLLHPRARAEREVEEALARAGIADADAIALPRDRRDREGWRDRTATARDAARRSLVAAPDHPTAHLLLALDAIATLDHQAAVGHLTSALGGIGTAGPPGLLGGILWHRGLAALHLLAPGADTAAFDDLQAGLDAGHNPGVEDLLDALAALEAHGSAHVVDLLAVLAERAPSDQRVVESLARAAAAGDPGAAALAQRVAADQRLALAARWSLLEAALAGRTASGMATTADDTLQQLADAMEDVVARAARVELDERWTTLLGSDDALRTALDPLRADALRVHALARLGRTGEARDAARAVFYRSLERPEIDPAEILELLRDLGASDTDLDPLQALLRTDAPERPEPGQPVRVLFVGGDETQARYQPAILRDLAQRHGDTIQVEWWHPGWSSGWAETAEAIEARYPQADVVVIMALVRTLFGRRLRRTAGEAGLPWVACTGHGRASLTRAIEHAATVTRDRRTP